MKKAAKKKSPARASAPVRGKKSPAIGALYGGGVVLGRFFDGLEPYLLIGALPKDGELGEQQYLDRLERIEGADNYYDGMANTKAMAKAGSKLALWALGLSSGGKKDWYIPSPGEAFLANAAKITGPNAFKPQLYWTSMQDASDGNYAWLQSVRVGYQYYGLKGNRYFARAVRRESIR